MKGRIKILAAVLSFAVVLLVAGGVALAHTGSVNPDVIHSCVNNGGQLTIVGPNNTCPGGNQTPLDWNATGPQGQQGNPGPAGGTGPVSGWEKVSNTTLTTTISVKTIVAICPSPKKVVGGGARTGNTLDTSKPRAVIGSFPTGSGNGWIAESMNAESLTAFAICANVAP